MRVQHYQRENTLGTHNFDCFQLYVGTLSNPDGEMFKGITILWAGSVSMEAHLLLTEDVALTFANYLDSIVKGELPSKHKVKGYGRGLLNFFMVLHMKFTKIEGNFIKCRMSFYLGTMWGRVNINSLKSCATSLRALYKNT